MKKNDFRKWLNERIKKKPIGDCISRCNAAEYALKVDFDKEYEKDLWQAAISKQSYSAREMKANIPIPKGFSFRNGCNVSQRMADLRSPVKRYFKFCQND